MTNLEQLEMIELGVDVWNEWRRCNPWIKKPYLSHAGLRYRNLSRVDLSGADLSWAQLTGADLSNANLSGAKFWHADLSGADFSNVDLSGVNLSSANLSNAKLSGVDLSRADLSHASLSGVDLSGMNLSNADLSCTKLAGMNFFRAKLRDADLSGTDLSHANLSFADLCGTHLGSVLLSGVNFSHANLMGNDLSGKNLTEVDLSGANLQFARLIRCNLTGAKLTGAFLYATARDDWIIDGIDCRYVYWDEEGEIHSPRDRDFAPGEFEQLYRAMPTIEYIFLNGMTPVDPLIMDRVVQAIREQNPEYDIKIDLISARGLAPSIKFTVEQERYKEPALQMIVAGYENRLRQLEGEKNRLYDLLALAIDKAGTKLLVAGRDIVNVEDNATINIDQHVTNLRDTVAALPEDSPAFGKKAKKAALDIIGGVMKDVAKGKVRDAAEQIIELGKDLGPVIVNTAAYGFFKSCLG